MFVRKNIFLSPVVLLALGAAVSLNASVASAQQPSNLNRGTISVVATGVCESDADQLEITATLSQSGKTIVEAGEKFKSSRTKLANTLNTMDFPDLVIISSGKSLASAAGNQMDMVAEMMGGGAPEADGGFTFKESMTIVVPHDSIDLSQVAELVKRIEEQLVSCGATLGSPTSPYTVSFGTTSSVVASLSDTSAAQTAAWSDAFSKAKAKAKTLAELSELKLGKIVSVREAEAAEVTIPDLYSEMMGDKTGNLGKVQTRRSLIVEFEAN